MKFNKKNIFGLFFTLILLLLIYSFYPLFFFKEDISNGPGRIYITDRNGEVITDKSKENGYFKSYSGTLNKDSKFINSLIEIEDKDYFNHYGISIKSKLRALKNNIINQKIVSGGSTITEQYIKNKYFKKSPRTYLQKIRESILAFTFSLKFSKEKILEKYLDSVYFGKQNYGIASAIEVYFGKEQIDDLSEEEIVLLLGLLHTPSIESLKEKAFVEYLEKTKKRLDFSYENTIRKIGKKKNIDRYPIYSRKLIKKYLHPNLPPLQGEGIAQKEIIIMSSIDSKLQDFSIKVINKILEELEGKNVTNSAIFALDPKTRKELLYIGSRDFYSNKTDGEVDMIKALRQPGSTMKLFLYLQALESGSNIDDLLVDVVSEYNSFQQNKVYISENYSLKEYGLVRFKKALGNSFNNATVRLARVLGLEKVYKNYIDYGFKLTNSAEYYGYSLVLGNPNISLENLVFSFSKLLDLKDKNKFLLYNILSDPDNRDISFGVNSILNSSIPQAVKTGTSSDFKDNIVVSYHPDLVIGVWVGNNDNSSMKYITGISGAGYIWHQVIEEAIKLGYIKDRKIEVPKGIEKQIICLDENCFRQEFNYIKQDKQYYSKIVDKIYDKRDLFGSLSEYEIERLQQLGIELK